MSFVSFKRQLSADLERMSSHLHRNESTACPSYSLTFRKLGCTSHNRPRPVRRARKYSTRHRNPKQESFPVTPPPSRREIFPPFLKTSKQCDWTCEDETYPEIYQSFSPGRQCVPIENCLEYPAIDLVAARGYLSARKDKPSENCSSVMGQNASGIFLPARQNASAEDCSSIMGRNTSGLFLPGRQNITGFFYPRGFSHRSNFSNGTLRVNSSLCQGRLGSGYQITDRKKEPTVRLVVKLPKTETAKPVVMFSYKHGRL